MNIVVNALSITPDRGGSKTYLTNVIDGILKIKEEKEVSIVCSIINRDIFRERYLDQNNVNINTIPLYTYNAISRVVLDQLLVPALCCKFGNRSVLLNENSTSSILSPLPEVVVFQGGLSVRSIRNRVPEDVNKTTSWTQRAYYDARLPLTIKHADKIVAVSKYLKDELSDLFPGYKEKICYVHEGVDLDVFTPSGEMWDRGSKYLLFVSSLFPYKRADQAIRAFALAREQNDDDSICLKIAGKDPDGNQLERLGRIARENGVRDEVEMLGRVPHDKMPALYRGAQCLLFPSAVETFGLPVLEAMACGTPVIASNRMSVPEIVGSAGIIVDPDDIEGMADAIRRVLTDSSLRGRLRDAGIRRAKKFTWDRTAHGLWNALKDAKHGE